MYDRKIDGRELTFGVSGRLYQSNVLLYDKETESLWSQLEEEAVTGEMTGTELRPLPSVVTTWRRWRRLHPATEVLSRDTGFPRPYHRDPYVSYARSSQLMFPPSRVDRRLRPKERVLGLEIDGEELAVPMSSLAKREAPVRVHLGKVDVEIRYDRGSETAEAYENGELIPSFVGYWFAWYAFHPETRVWGRDSSEDHSRREPSSVRVLAHQGSWGDLTGITPGAELADRGSFYVISGSLRNESKGAVQHVRLSYELLGKDGEVVFREDGYNRRAEDMREVAGGKKSRSAPRAIEPIGPDQTDSFRMFFFRDELPPFEGYRVVVEDVCETSDAPCGAGAASRE